MFLNFNQPDRYDSNGCVSVLSGFLMTESDGQTVSRTQKGSSMGTFVLRAKVSSLTFYQMIRPQSLFRVSHRQMFSAS